MGIKNFVRPAIFTGVVLAAGVIGNQTVDGFNWSAFDFVWVTVVLMTAGLLFEFISTRSSSLVFKAAVGVAVLASLMLVWVNGAVGVLGNEDNPANLMYFAVIVTGLMGLGLSRFKAKGLARTMFTMALVQAIIPVIALSVWGDQYFDDASPIPVLVQVLGITGFFCTMFVFSGLLFRTIDLETKNQISA